MTSKDTVMDGCYSGTLSESTQAPQLALAGQCHSHSAGKCEQKEQPAAQLLYSRPHSTQSMQQYNAPLCLRAGGLTAAAIPAAAWPPSACQPEASDARGGLWGALPALHSAEDLAQEQEQSAGWPQLPDRKALGGWVPPPAAGSELELLGSSASAFSLPQAQHQEQQPQAGQLVGEAAAPHFSSQGSFSLDTAATAAAAEPAAAGQEGPLTPWASPLQQAPSLCSEGRLSPPPLGGALQGEAGRRGGAATAAAGGKRERVGERRQRLVEEALQEQMRLQRELQQTLEVRRCSGLVPCGLWCHVRLQRAARPLRAASFAYLLPD